MAIRSKTDDIVREDCLKLVQEVIGVRLSPIYGIAYNFVTEAAKLAADMFRSRTDLEYLAAHSVDERDHATQTLWAGSLFSFASYFGQIGYDEVAERTNPEVADYLKFVVPDNKVPVFQAISTLLAELGQCNSKQYFGPIFSVAAGAALTAQRLGPTLTPLRFCLDQSAIAAKLWGVHYTIEQLNRACLTRWSAPVLEYIMRISEITKRWTTLPQFPTVTYKKPVAWQLDMSLPAKYDITKFIEL